MRRKFHHWGFVDGPLLTFPSRLNRNPGLKRRLEWFLVIQYHFLVSAALALIVVGVVFIENGNKGSTTSAVLKIGATLVLLSWILLIIWTSVSIGRSQMDINALAYVDGTKVRIIPLTLILASTNTLA